MSYTDNYNVSLAEERRVHAMDEAIRNANPGTKAAHLVEDAKEIEAYLKGSGDG